MGDMFNGGYIYESARWGWMVCLTCEGADGKTYQYGDLMDAKDEAQAREMMLEVCREEGLPATFTTHRYENASAQTAFIPKKKG